MAGLMISASYQTFSSICPAKSHLAIQIYCTILMEISMSLLKLVNVGTIFSHHHKHCIIYIWYIFSKYNSLPLWLCVYTCPSVCTHVPVNVHMSQCMSTCPSVCTQVTVYAYMSQCMTMYTCPSVCTHVPAYVHMSQCIHTCHSEYEHVIHCIGTHVIVYVHMS